MARLSRPLNAAAVAQADQAFYARHPEMTKDGERLPLSATDPDHAALQREWTQLYEQAGGSVETPKERCAALPPGATTVSCPEDNWIELRYLYCDGDPVAGAEYVVRDASSGTVVATGSLDAKGFARQALPPWATNVSYDFRHDPARNDYRRVPITNEEANKVQEGWFDRMKSGLADAGSWTWETLQGDFNEDPTMGQVATNAVITMIPVVDQVGDVRDLTANLKFLIWDKRYDDKWVWLALVLTLMGLIPVVGSAVKGVLKVVAKGMKTGASIPVKTLVEVLNKFHKGNAMVWLRELVAKLPSHAATCKTTLRAILTDLKARLIALMIAMPASLAGKVKPLIDNIEVVGRKADDNIDKLIEEVQEKMKKALDEAPDYERKGATKTPDGAKRVQEVQEPPDVDSFADGPRSGATKGALPPLRQAYVDAVSKLKAKADAMRAAGASSEEIARALHADRRALGEEFKALTPPDKLEEIYQRNLEKYGDKLGPTIDWLRVKGKSWDQIIESSTRPGGKDLGF